MTSPARVWVLAAIAILLPLGIYLVRSRMPALGAAPDVERYASILESSVLPLEEHALPSKAGAHPRVAHVQIVDLDEDGTRDIVVCDALESAVLWYRQSSPGKWERRRIHEDDLIAPGHATVVDLDRDGDLDIVVSVLGSVWPDNRAIGQVVLLENDGQERYTSRVLLDDVRRVTDVQPADFDADGDLDLAVAVFGYSLGEILWLENRGDGRFRDHRLMFTDGTVHVPVADYDGDGDPDFVAIISQNEEELWGFENLGGGRFKPRLLFMSVNFDLGGTGLVRTDLDGDGDADLLLSAGDNLEINSHYPQPYHGCFWFENQGAWVFASRKIADVGGTYGAAPGDLDGDGDLDVALVSMFNDFAVDGAASVVWLENDGQQNFRAWQIADRPIHQVTVDCGDLNGDGRADIVAGGFHMQERLYLKSPVDRLGNVTLWLSGKE